MKCANTLTPVCDRFANEVADTQITLYWTIGRSVKSLLEAELAETLYYSIATATEMDHALGKKEDSRIPHSQSRLPPETKSMRIRAAAFFMATC